MEMRRIATFLAMSALLGCSSPSPTTTDAQACATASCEDAGSPPIITFMEVPSSVSRQSGTYTLGVVLSYVDDGERVAALHFESSALTTDATLPGFAEDGMYRTTVTLPRETQAGVLDVTLTLVSASGLSSAPYKSSVDLL